MKSSSRTFARRAVAAAALAIFLTWAVPLPAAAAEWAWPVRGRIITSYANDNSRPYAGGMHRGIDITVPVGTAVAAAAAGRVTHAAPLGSSGLTVAIRTSDERYLTSYLHLSRITVDKGAVVGAGDKIGEVGTSGTGSASVPHLHFGVRLADSDRFYVDPLTLLPALAVAPTDPGTGPLSAPAPVRAEPETVQVPVLAPQGLPTPATRPAGAVRPFPVLRPFPAARKLPAARAAPVRRPAALRPLPAGRSLPAWLRGAVRLPAPNARRGTPVSRAPATMPVSGTTMPVSGRRQGAARGGTAGLSSGPPEAERAPALGAVANARERSSQTATARREEPSPTPTAGAGGQPSRGRMSVVLGVILVALAVAGTRARKRLSAAAAGALARLRGERAKQSPAPRHADASARPLSQMG